MSILTLEQAHIEYYKDMFIKIQQDPRHKHWFELKERAAYQTLITLSMFRDLHVPPYPEKGKKYFQWKRNVSVLELGFGIQCYGINMMVNKYNINPKGIYGIEASDIAIKNAKIISPNSNFFKVDYGTDELLKLLDFWIANNITFNVIMCKYFLESFENHEEILDRIKLLLKPINPETLKIRGIFAITTKANGSGDLFIQKNRTTRFRANGRAIIFEDDSWQTVISSRGLEIYDSLREFSETYTLGYNTTTFARRIT